MSRIYRAIYPNSYHYYSKPIECPSTVMHYNVLPSNISVVHIDNQHAKLMKTGQKLVSRKRTELQYNV